MKAKKSGTQRRTLTKAKRTGRRRNTGSKNLKPFLFIFVFILVLGAGVAYFFKSYLYLPSPQSTPDSAPVAFAELLSAVDSSLWDVVSDLGLENTSLSLEWKSRKMDDGIEWTHKKIKIKLSEQMTTNRLEDAVYENLFAPNIEIRAQQSDHSYVAYISIFKRPTHELSFVFKPEPDSIDQDENLFRSKGLEKRQEDFLQDPSLYNGHRGGKPKVAIIVDDLGVDPHAIDRLVRIDAELTFAVLPNYSYSRYTAEVAHKHGRDVLLHLPMEPKSSSGYGGADAGQGVLLVGSSENEIISTLERDLEAVPYITGVNNHMGSRFTEDAELMELVLNNLKSKGLFFVDSRTSSETQGYKVAKRLGIKTVERNVFLDEATLGPEYLKAQLRKLVQVSKQKGFAVGICHPYSHTLDVLTEMIPQMKEEVEFIPISEVVN